MVAMPLSAVGLRDRLALDVTDLELNPKEAETEAEEERDALPSVETAGEGEGGQETAPPTADTSSSKTALRCIMSPPRPTPPRSRRVTSASPAALVYVHRDKRWVRRRDI